MIALLVASAGTLVAVTGSASGPLIPLRATWCEPVTVPETIPIA